MDAELIGRMLEGESEATLAVRNHLRTVATRVLTAPQWGLTEGPELTRAEQDAAAEAINFRPATPVSLAVAAMASASRIALEKARHKEGHSGTEHPDARLVVALALQTASAAQANNLKAHMERCPVCRRHMEMTQHAVKSAASATAAAEKLVAEGHDPHGLEAAMQAAAAEDEARARKPPRPRPPPPEPAKGSLSALFPLLIVFAFLGYFAYRHDQLTPEEATWLVAELLPPEIPPTSRAEQYGGTAREGLLAMREGDCRDAANRLKSAVKHDPDDLYLRYYEGLAYVCQRKGPEAVEALSEVRDQAADPPFGLDWWLGQALLLNGDLDAGLATLDQLASSQHPRANQAEQLASAVRERVQ